MASGQCEYCFSHLTRGSRICPRCGRKKRYTKRLLAGLVLVQAATIACFTHFAVPKIPGTLRFVSDDGAPPITLKIVKAEKGWTYFETSDELVHDVTKHARVWSVSKPGNVGDLTTGVLELRTSSTYGKSVVITLRRQPFDRVDEQCELRAKFDTGHEQVFHASGSADANNATLVVDDTDAFTGQLAGAHKLTLVAELSEKTERRTDFSLEGLSWN